MAELRPPPARVWACCQDRGELVFLDTVDSRAPLVMTMPEPGSPVPPGTAPDRAHTEIPRPAPIVDAGGVLPSSWSR